MVSNSPGLLWRIIMTLLKRCLCHRLGLNAVLASYRLELHSCIMTAKGQSVLKHYAVLKVLSEASVYLPFACLFTFRIPFSSEHLRVEASERASHGPARLCSRGKVAIRKAATCEAMSPPLYLCELWLVCGSQTSVRGRPWWGSTRASAFTRMKGR